MIGKSSWPFFDNLAHPVDIRRLSGGYQLEGFIIFRSRLCSNNHYHDFGELFILLLWMWIQDLNSFIFVCIKPLQMEHNNPQNISKSPKYCNGNCENSMFSIRHFVIPILALQQQIHPILSWVFWLILILWCGSEKPIINEDEWSTTTTQITIISLSLAGLAKRGLGWEEGIRNWLLRLILKNK